MSLSVNASAVDNLERQSLGISAKSIHTRQGAARSADSIEAGLVAKARRFTMQRTAQALLYKPSETPAGQYRVCWCSRTIVTRGESIGVYRTAGGESARFSGLSTCGSVWHCPVCSAKITETRRKDLDLALTGWVKGGGLVQLMTLTFPHEADQALSDLMVRFAKALQRFKNSRDYKNIMTAAGRAGSIRSLEATWGANGWHPHTHDLVFLRRALTMTEVDTLKSAWVKQCWKAGLGGQAQLSDMLEHGLDIQDGRYAAEYILKFGHDAAWGASAELTKPHSKCGKVAEFGGSDHYTPFQLLAWAEAGDEKAGVLFREFAEVFEGKRMLSWSPKLRQTLTGCEHELSDEEIAAHEDPAPDETRVGQLDLDQLRVLISRNRMGEFIGYVARCCSNPDTGQEDIDDYIKAIEKTKPTHGSSYRKKNDFTSGFTVLH